eukprot:1739851-Amphidinium_carterae.1
MFGGAEPHPPELAQVPLAAPGAKRDGREYQASPPAANMSESPVDSQWASHAVEVVLTTWFNTRRLTSSGAAVMQALSHHFASAKLLSSDKAFDSQHAVSMMPQFWLEFAPAALPPIAAEHQ